MNEATKILSAAAIELLKKLIAIPSLSKEEKNAAGCLQQFFDLQQIPTQRSANNIWARNRYYDAAKPTILLNSHLDTVPANSSYTKQPHKAIVEADKLFGLGSTDAGGSLVSLAAAFIHNFNRADMPYNIIFAATAEEEISGLNGIESLFKQEAFGKCFVHPASFAIVGEPTQLQLAIAEKGLLVLDCTTAGKAGHAARNEGENAIYNAMQAIEWIRNYTFEYSSPLLGKPTMTVTSINTINRSHNVIPDQCSFVVDIRVTELYSHAFLLQLLKENTKAIVEPRSMRLRATIISMEHPVIKAGLLLGKTAFGSPTLSDKALIPIPTLKCGPGNSAQSHTANEFILLKDIEEGIDFYINLLNSLFSQ